MAPVKNKEFYPDYLVEILIVILLTLGTVFILAMLFTPAVGREINFSAAYRPKPEWYFLWDFELIRYFPGGWAFIGTVMIPVLAIALLLAIPFIDRGSVATRRVAAVCFTFLLSSFFILTIISILRQ